MCSNITYGITIFIVLGFSSAFIFYNYERIIRRQRRRNEDVTRVVFDSSRLKKPACYNVFNIRSHFVILVFY